MVGPLLVPVTAVCKRGAVRLVVARLLRPRAVPPFDAPVARPLAGFASVALGVNARPAVRVAPAKAVAQCIMNDLVLRMVGFGARVVVALAVRTVDRHYFLVDELLQL